MVSTSSTNANSKALLAGLLNAQSALYKTQQKVMAQKNILTPSDSPTGTAIIMDANQNLSNISSFKDNINTVDMGCSMLDSLYGTIWDKVSRINDLAISAANGTNASVSHMEGFYTEVKALKEDLVRLANTKFNGEYVFSGANTALPAFTLGDDGSITYNGTSSLNTDGSEIAGAEEYYTKMIEVSKDTFVSINSPGDSVFGFVDKSTNPPTGTGLFYALDALENAMIPENYDQEAIRAQLDNIQAGMENINAYRTQNGITQSRIATIKDFLDNQELLTTEKKSNVQDIDFAEAYSKLTQQYYAYQASMKIASQSMQTSLLNYL